MLEEDRRFGRAPTLAVATAAVVLVALALVSAASAGSGDASEATVAILREPGHDGPVRAGVPTAFTWLLLDEDGKPFVHHDAVFRIRHDGTTILETTAETGHDYDGIDTYRAVFPGPGTYTAHVSVMDGEGDALVEETVRGRVLPAPNRTAPAFLEAPATVAVGEEVTFTYGLGAEGDPVPATDMRLRVLRTMDGFLEAELDTSARDGLHEVTYRFDEEGTYEVRVAGARPGSGAVEADAASATVEVESAPSPPAGGPPTQEPLENTVAAGDGGDAYDLYGTYDPYTSIGPHGRIRLGAVVLDGRQAVPGVDYDATLVAPDGARRLAVDDLREDDGILTVTVSPSTIGDHTLRVQAEKGDWSGSVKLRFSVHPPAGALGAGPQFTTLSAPNDVVAGEPGRVAFEVTDAAGTPLPHSEVDFRVRGPDGVPVLDGKLHSHENGRFPVELAFPASGRHALAGSPETLQPAPTNPYYGPEPGTRPTFGFTVAPAAGADEAADLAETAAGGDGAMEAAAGPVLALAGLVLAAGAARRP